MKRTKDELRRDELLAKVPAGAKFIQVKDEKGNTRYRDLILNELAASDEIQVNQEGKPIVTKAALGRRKKVTLEPATAMVAAILVRKEQAIADDPITKVAKDNPESPDVLHQIVLALSNEAASIEFERKEAERNGQDTGGLSTRRIAALKAIGDTWLKRKEQIAAREIELESPVFAAMFNFIMETFRDALNGCEVRPELVETVFAKFAKLISDDNWKADARNRMKNIL